MKLRITLAGMAFVGASQAFGAQSHFLKDITVQAGDTLDGDLSLYRGTLQLDGAVKGNVAIMFGDCRLGPRAFIDGNLAVVHGQLAMDDSARVSGRISQKDFLARGAGEGPSTPFAMEEVELDGESAQAPQSAEQEADSSLSWLQVNGWSWKGSGKEEPFFSFNRVAGLQLGMEFRGGRSPVKGKKLMDLTGFGAYAFAAHRPEWRLKLRRRLVDSGRLYLAAGLHRMTDTQDRWLLSSKENSLAGWLLKRDYRDYYDNQGFLAEVGGFMLEDLLHVNAAWFRERYRPMSTNTQWNWAPTRDPYRENLFSHSLGFTGGQNEGLRLGLDLRLWKSGEEEEEASWQRGLGLTCTWEKGFDRTDRQDDYDYERFLANARIALPFGHHVKEQLSGRVLVANQWGMLPEPYLFRLGGPDALPGFRPKSIDLAGSDRSTELLSMDPAAGGESMVLISLEHRIKGKDIGVWPFDNLDLLIMGDAGQLSHDGLGDMTRDGFHSDMGLGVAEEDDSFRFGLFRSTESSDADWRFLFRLQRRF